MTIVHNQSHDAVQYVKFVNSIKDR